MGHISNQWLNRGEGIRNRSYHPVPVTIYGSKSTSLWARNHGATFKLKARRQNGEYHLVNLSQSELDQAAEAMVECISPEVRAKLILSLCKLVPQGSVDEVVMSALPHMSTIGKEELVTSILRGLSHLLRTLAIDLQKRVRLPASQR